MAAFALGAVGTVFQTVGAMKAAKAEKKSEKLRAQQMELEATRKRRENIRESLIKRAEVTANAVSQGAGEGSGLSGGLAGIHNDAARRDKAVSEDLTIGRGIFTQNAKASKAKGIQALGAGFSSAGALIAEQGQALARIGGY